MSEKLDLRLSNYLSLDSEQKEYDKVNFDHQNNSRKVVMNNSNHTQHKGSFIFLTVMLSILIVYFMLTRLFPSVDLSSVELIVFLGLLLMLMLFIVVGVFRLLIRFISKKQLQKSSVTGHFMINILVVVVVLAGVVLGSQWRAHTPAILAKNGDVLEGCIASLENVKLGGVDQWLIIRGHDIKNPVLLFLSGCPGASEAARVLRFNQELEKHFTVVIWEQRGCGKSYPSIPNQI